MKEIIVFSVLIASVLCFALAYNADPVVIEKVVEKIVEKPVIVEKIIEKPVVVKENCKIRDSPPDEPEEGYGELDDRIEEVENNVNEPNDEPYY